MPDMIASHYLDLDDDALLRQCDVHCYRASGPGGQKRNKTSSAVRLHHQPTGLMAKGEEDRSQHVNKARALKRLRLKLSTELLRDLDLECYSPSRRLRRRLHNGRLKLRLKEEDALAVLNEILSVIHSDHGRVRGAAAAIGVSTANLVKLLRIDPHVWRKVDQLRRANGLRALQSDS